MVATLKAQALYDSPFAAITEKTDAMLRELPPAAGALWRELRRRTVPGKSHEFNLNDLAEKLDYSVRWLRSALKQLQEEELIVIDRKWWGAIFSVKILDPGIGHKPSTDRSKPSIDRRESSPEQPSNPDSVVVQDLKNLKKMQTEPTPHPVKELTEKVEPVDPQSLDFEALTETACQTVSQLGIQINPTIAQAIPATICQLGAAALDRIQQAAQVAYESPPTRKNGKTTCREALFMKALKRGWSPWSQRSSQKAEPTLLPEPLPASEPYRSPVPDLPKLTKEQKDWIDLARQVGLAVASTIEHGELVIFTNSGQELWTTMVKLHPLEELQELAAAQSQSPG